MDILKALANLYAEMEAAYHSVATSLDFTCQHCPDNCCDSYFQHHTYLEWAYLWRGLSLLPADRSAAYQARAQAAVVSYQEALAKDERPLTMCPVNDQGRCGIYQHRLLICRLHGVPATITAPDGRHRQFPGCFRCQELTSRQTHSPSMDRSGFFKTMVSLEQALCKGRSLPKIRMTLAEMLLQEPPVSF